MIAATRRNVFFLALCQALFMTGTSMVLTVTALAGKMLYPDSGLATLPIALQFITTMVITVPASFVMRRYGRRFGFVIGALTGGMGGIINVFALMTGNFLLFCMGSALIGVLNGFALYYRFAAADCADEEHKSRAISLVLAGGVIAAFSGPNLAILTVDAISSVTYAGSFMALAALQIGTLTVLLFVDIPRLTAEERKDQGRPLRDILRLPQVGVAILTAVAAYSSMSLIMTSTPLAMVDYGHDFANTAFVIQWHVFAMFAPSFFTGHLIKRFGFLPIIMAGTISIGACVWVNHLGATGVVAFTLSLILLGIGWNFMFVGGTAMLASMIAKPEQAKVQGLNDFLVFGSVAAASLSAGMLQHNLGWIVVNLAVIPTIVVGLGATIWLWSTRSARAV